MDCGDMDWLANNFCEDFANVGLDTGNREGISNRGNGMGPGGAPVYNPLASEMPYSQHHPHGPHGPPIPRQYPGPGMMENGLGKSIQNPPPYSQAIMNGSHDPNSYSPPIGTDLGDDPHYHQQGMLIKDEDRGHYGDDLDRKSSSSSLTDLNRNIQDPDSYQDHKVQQADSTADFASFKKRDQKRRPKPKDGTLLMCVICGDRALGYNFDAITCESCKAFFRRNALKAKVFTCSFEGNCKLDPHTRKFCSGCRLKKCFEAGMKKEWILSDDQLAKRRKKTKSCGGSMDEPYGMMPSQVSQPMLTSPTGFLSPKMEMFSPTSNNSSDGEITTTYISDSTDNSVSSPSQLMSLSPTETPVKREPNEEDFPRPLPPHIAAEIENLEKDYGSVFDCGYSEDQAKKFTEKPHNANDLFNMTDIFIRRLIKFAKHIPEFKSLKQEDQIYLLKGGIMEIMVLRSAMGFDPMKYQWKIKQMQEKTTHQLDPKIIQEQLGSEMYQEHMKFVTSLHQLTRSDKTVLTLLFVTEIFSPDRPGVSNKEAVMVAQEKFTTWLRHYLESLMPVCEAKAVYPKLIMKLRDVRTLGESSAQLASHLDITKLEPLLIEVFSLQK